MKYLLLLILCALFCLTVTAGAEEILTSGISSAAATTEFPPFDATRYISDAQAAIAERNWTNALVLTTRGLAWYPDNAELFCLQGYTFRKLGQYSKSVEAVSEGIRQDPKPVRYANRGYGYLALGNYSAALADAEVGISLNATYPTTYGVKALALQGMGRNAEARTAIDTALSLDPESAHYWHVKGRLLAAAGDCTGAGAALERSLAIDPDYDLPYPGFTNVRGNLETLNTACGATQQRPAPTRSTAGVIAAASILAAIIVFTKRR